MMIEEILLEKYYENNSPYCDIFFFTNLDVMNLSNENNDQKKALIINTTIFMLLSFSILLSMVAFVQNANALDFAVLPPEINSARLFSGIDASHIIIKAESIFESIHSTINDIENIN